MKVKDDKLLCKVNNKNILPVCVQNIQGGNLYSVVNIDSWNLPGVLGKFSYACVNDDKNGLNFIFAINKPTQVYIWDYFYTSKELRKKKLELLDEI